MLHTAFYSRRCNYKELNDKILWERRQPDMEK